MAHLSAVRTIEGSLVQLEVDDELSDLLNPWCGHIRYIPKYGSRNTTTDMWAFDLAPTSSLGSGIFSVGGRERERFALAGGEVIIYDCSNPSDARWAAWMGPWHMAHAMFYQPEWEAGDIAEFFSRVSWTDTPEGLTAHAKRFELLASMYLQTVAGVGSLKVESKAAGAGVVPKWRGYQGRAGEIWRLAAQENASAQPLLMATSSAVATLVPWDAPRGAQPGVAVRAAGVRPEEAAATFLSGIRRLDWKA